MNVSNLRILHFYSLKDIIPGKFHPILIRHILKIKQYNNVRKLQIMKYINKKTLTFINEPITKD